MRSVTQSFSGITLKAYVCVCARYPTLLEENIHRKLLKSQNPLSPADRYCCTWRGGGFRDSCKLFFERMTGKFYRVPGFLATSLEKETAMSFLSRANRKYPRILWCILVSTTACVLQHLTCFNLEFASLFILHGCSWTLVAKRTGNSDVSTLSLCSRLRLWARWSFSTRRTPCSRQVFGGRAR